jgi:hypothetical protein
MLKNALSFFVQSSDTVCSIFLLNNYLWSPRGPRLKNPVKSFQYEDFWNIRMYFIIVLALLYGLLSSLNDPFFQLPNFKSKLCQNFTNTFIESLKCSFFASVQCKVFSALNLLQPQKHFNTNIKLHIQHFYTNLCI